MTTRTALFVSVALLLATPPLQGADEVKDYSSVKPEELGLHWVQEKKDPKTGFVIGGRNPTPLILKLTEIAGRTIVDLEKDMRPGQISTAGFLGKEEKLLEVLAADNRFVVDELKLTHQQLARHLHLLGAIAAKHADKGPIEIKYQGRKYRLQVQFFPGFVNSPFQDGTKTNCEASITNLDTGKRLTWSLLVPHLIERYGFYEGHGTRFRVDPRAILDVFDFLKKRPGKS